MTALEKFLKCTLSVKTQSRNVIQMLFVILLLVASSTGVCGYSQGALAAL